MCMMFAYGVRYLMMPLVVHFSDDISTTEVGKPSERKTRTDESIRKAW